MNKFFMALFLTVMVLIIGHLAVTSKGPLRDKLLSDPGTKEIVARLDKLRTRVKEAPARLGEKPPSPEEPAPGHEPKKDKQQSPEKKTPGELFKKLFSPEKAVPEDKPKEMVGLHFKDGSVMEGELISESKDEYLVNWQGSKVVVYADQVERIERGIKLSKSEDLISGQQAGGQWPYQNDIVIRLTNTVVLDAEITRVDKDKLILLYSTEGGGRIEQEIERSKVEYLIFKPVDNKESRKIESYLKELFPKMKFYQEGGFTIVTDSYITWVKEYRKALREAYTNLYFNFFQLYKDRKPKVQNFLVIFDSFSDYVDYAATDGVPGWAAVGYFSPSDEVLYLFNILGDEFSEFLFEAFVGESGRAIDDIVETVEGRVNKRYHIFIGGQAKRIKDKFWEAYDYYKGMFREMTMNTLRHEFTHEVFHNWRLQGIILSDYKKDKASLIKRKKEFLETKDCKKKAKLIRSMVSLRREAETEPFEIKAANSWLAEGAATYCGTDPPGAQDNMWLFLYQDMVKKGPVYPLESLTYSKMGSFPGACPIAQLHLYAQSWAFFGFLMEKYPREFMEYQKKMADQAAPEEQEDIEWLSQALGKDLKVVEAEFMEYMDTYEEVDDPNISNFMKVRSIFRD